MPTIKNNFLQGKMNKDLDDRILPNGQYRDGRNIKVSKSESSNVGVVQNIKGNDYAYLNPTVIDSSLAETIRCGVPLSNDGNTELWDTIGYYANSLEGRIYWYVTSFTGDESDEILNFKAAQDISIPNASLTHSGTNLTFTVANNAFDIQVGMKVTGTYVTADTYVESVTPGASNTTITINKAPSQSFNGSDLTLTHTCRLYYYNTKENMSGPQTIIDSHYLNFSKAHPINHVNLLGNLLFWTDNYNQPRRINVDKELGFYANDEYLEDKISVAQFSPISAPKVIMSAEASTDVGSLHLKDKFVKFAYRYQFENKEFSLISPFSQACFIPGFGKTDPIPTVGGGFSNGQGGMLSAADQVKAVKETVVESMQNRVNRVELQIDMPITDTTITDDASAKIDGNTGNTTTTQIDNINGTIANNSTLVTARGDNAKVTTSNNSSTITTAAALSHPILDNTNVYFFNQSGSTTSPAAYVNELKIKKIEILYAESDSLALKVVDTIDIDGSTEFSFRAEPINDQIAKLVYTIKFVYNSTKPIKTLPSSEITRVSDIVPLRAHTQEVSGNRVIYGNFSLNRPLTTAISKDRFDVTHGNQTNYNDEYILHSVKSNREYSAGLVLSDRYGRQSTVFLPTNSTTFVNSQATNTNVKTDWTHSVLKIDFKNQIQDVYHKDTNPLGWYSYKVVVKQAEQEYYNVYAPALIDNIPSGNTRSWMTLYGDNINKVPRDVNDTNTETGTQGSSTQLLPRFIITTGSTQAPQDDNNFLDVISIGTALEHGLNNTINSGNSSDPLAELYTSQKDPLLAELPDGFGRDHSGSMSGGDSLVVFETKPFKSALDIYFETSTSGLLEHLNTQIATQLTSVVSTITLTTAGHTAFTEAVNNSATIGEFSSVDNSGSTISNETYQLVSVTDGGGTDRSADFEIPNGTKLLKTKSFFVFRNTVKDTFTFKVKVTDANGESVEEDKQLTLQNVAPTINVGTTPMSISASLATGLQIRIISGTNGSADLANNTLGLSYAITSGNTAGKFALSNLGSLTIAGGLTSGSQFTLTIQVTDAGGLQASADLVINVTAATVKSFYRSNGAINATTACTRQINQQAWHNGSGDIPTDGDVVYLSQNATSVYNGGNQWHSFAITAVDASGSAARAQINSSGVVNNVGLCEAGDNP